MNIEDTYKRALSGDERAQDELFRHLSVRFGYIVRQKIHNKEDCEEVVQDAVMSVLKNYRSTTITVSFASWAQRVVENKIIDHLRKTKRTSRKEVLVEDVELAGPGTRTDPELSLMLSSCLDKVARANPRFATILKLRYQGYSMDEVCQTLNVTKTNAYAILSRARAMLLECLEGGEKA